LLEPEWTIELMDLFAQNEELEVQKYMPSSFGILVVKISVYIDLV